jgi:hypothetical protein
MGAQHDQVRPGSSFEKGLDWRVIHDDRIDLVRRGFSGNRRQMIRGPCLRHLPFHFEPLDLLDREIWRRLKPFGVQRTEPGLKGRRHHTRKRQRPNRRLTEVHTHQHDLRRALPASVG